MTKKQTKKKGDKDKTKRFRLFFFNYKLLPFTALLHLYAKRYSKKSYQTVAYLDKDLYSNIQIKR